MRRPKTPLLAETTPPRKRRKAKRRVVRKQPAVQAPEWPHSCIPAPVGTFVLHVIDHPDGPIILKHVCTHFERFTDRIVPRCMIPADDTVIEAACLHPTGEISGSPKAPLTFANIDQYRLSIGARYRKIETVHEAANEAANAAVKKVTTRNSEAFERARKLLSGEDEDLVG